MHPISDHPPGKLGLPTAPPAGENGSEKFPLLQCQQPDAEKKRLPAPSENPRDPVERKLLPCENLPAPCENLPAPPAEELAGREAAPAPPRNTTRPQNLPQEQCQRPDAQKTRIPAPGSRRSAENPTDPVERKCEEHPERETGPAPPPKATQPENLHEEGISRAWETTAGAPSAPIIAASAAEPEEAISKAPNAPAPAAAADSPDALAPGDENPLRLQLAEEKGWYLLCRGLGNGREILPIRCPQQLQASLAADFVQCDLQNGHICITPVDDLQSPPARFPLSLFNRRVLVFNEEELELAASFTASLNHAVGEQAPNPFRLLPLELATLVLGDSTECRICRGEIHRGSSESVCPHISIESVIVPSCPQNQHIFHVNCLLRWVLGGRFRCPVCRQPVDVFGPDLTITARWKLEIDERRAGD